MKQAYTKPALVKECFDVESQISSCSIVNNAPSLMKQCSYDVKGLGFYAFAESWASCIDQKFPDDSALNCYHAGANNVFGSY
ncbi:MAG: hypothetical protein E7467_07355 [Ruminococcaceae bacterium]|nr:hypothetical protein [Oscillospiraceae bacterium]